MSNNKHNELIVKINNNLVISKAIQNLAFSYGYKWEKDGASLIETQLDLLFYKQNKTIKYNPASEENRTVLGTNDFVQIVEWFESPLYQIPEKILPEGKFLIDKTNKTISYDGTKLEDKDIQLIINTVNNSLHKKTAFVVTNLDILKVIFDFAVSKNLRLSEHVKTTIREKTPWPTYLLDSDWGYDFDIGTSNPCNSEQAIYADKDLSRLIQIMAEFSNSITEINLSFGKVLWSKEGLKFPCGKLISKNSVEVLRRAYQAA